QRGAGNAAVARALAGPAGGHEPTAEQRVVQRLVGFEFQTRWGVALRVVGTSHHDLIKETPLLEGQGWHAVSDGGALEFVTDPFDEHDPAGLFAALTDLRRATWS